MCDAVRVSFSFVMVASTEHHLTPHDGVAICRWVDEHQMCILSALLGLAVNSRYNVAFYIGGLLPTNIPIP
jgi:hypothetical protein